MNRKKIGIEIKQRRVAKMLTRHELAQLVGVPHKVISSIEDGRNGYTADQLMRVWLVLVPTIIE